MRHHADALKQAKHRDRSCVIDLQSDLLRDLGTRLVAPLQRATSVNPAEIIGDLMPRVSIAGEAFVVFSHESSANPLKGLAHTAADFPSQSSLLINALDRSVG